MTLTSEREAGRECNRSGGLCSRPLMNVPNSTFKVETGGSQRVLRGVSIKLIKYV